MMLPFAVHIADGLLTWPWQLGGAVAALAALAWSMQKIDDRAIPRIGVLTAAFFVASQIHVPLGVVSVHLLLNGLIGALLRRAAPLAIVLGLVLQAALFGHGGWLVLGVNACVQIIPALLAAGLFRELLPRIRPFLVGASVGGLAATLTVVLNFTVLWLGGVADLRVVAVVSLLSHLPVIAIESLLVGFACTTLVNAKPEWMGLSVNSSPPATAAPHAMS